MNQAKYFPGRGVIALALGLLLSVSAAQAARYELRIGETAIEATGKRQTALAINGSVPGPTLRFKEGEGIVIDVSNTLDVDTSIHWHGLILPYQQDGVPGISFPGIKPGQAHTYRFPAQQSGTYWYHSHSGLQEQQGIYGAIVIEPRAAKPFTVDREHVVVLSDWHPSAPEKVLRNLKIQADYYNYNQRTVGDFWRDARESGLSAALKDRRMWGDMRMTPTDIADISGYTFLVNGNNPEQNWTGLFKPGERVRLRLINASAMTYFDVRLPGLTMTVVQADGNNVRPVEIDELRIAVAETYDVIVQPKMDMAYALVAEPMSRGGFALGTLAPREGMRADFAMQNRPRPLLTMADMGMAHDGMDHGQMQSSAEAPKPSPHAGMNHGDMHGKPAMDHSQHSGQSQMPAMDHGAMATDAAATDADPFYAPGSGLTPTAANGGKFLSYADLRAQTPLYPERPPTREIELRLTGNMERYFWSINGKKYSEAEPIRLVEGERVRFKFVNETMMTHPMHLHGMWSILDNGSGQWNPVKHVISIAPGTTVYTETEVDAVGEWAFHCHLLYHMATGMFRKVIVEPAPHSAMTMQENAQ